MKELFEIQQRLKAPKDLKNDFAKYMYRSAEDVLDKVKPILAEFKCTILLSDEMVMLGDRYYLKSTATLTNESGEKETVTAFVREEDSAKGMSNGQLAGASSSYCRKYALGGLFAISTSKDLDEITSVKPENIVKEVMAAKSREELAELYAKYKDYASDASVKTALETMGKKFPRKEAKK